MRRATRLRIPLALAVFGAMLAGGLRARSDEPSLPATVFKGSYQIRNKAFGDVLRPREANSAELTPIVLYPRTDWKCLTWRIEPGEDGGERFLNHFTSKTFQPVGKVEKGVPVLQVSPNAPSASSRLWRFVPTGDKTYRIIHNESGLALTAVKDGDEGFRIVLAPWEGRDEQKWEMLDGPTHFSG